MKMSYFRKLIVSGKGEIASILTLVAVILMAAGAFAGTKLAQTGGRLNPLAEDTNCKAGLTKVYIDSTNLNGEILKNKSFKCWIETDSDKDNICAFSVNDQTWPSGCEWDSGSQIHKDTKWKIGSICNASNLNEEDKIQLKAMKNVDKCISKWNDSANYITSGNYYYKTKPGSGEGPTGATGNSDPQGPTGATGPNGTSPNTTFTGGKENPKKACFHLGVDIAGETKQEGSNKVGNFNMSVKVHVDDGQNSKHVQFFVGDSQNDKLSHPWIGNDNPYVVGPQFTESPVKVGVNETKELKYRVKIDECRSG